MAQHKRTVLFFVSLAVVLLANPEAWAGCGCDHPTPCQKPVMPPFSSPGDQVKLTGTGFSTEHDGNLVLFGSSYNVMKDREEAKSPERLVVTVPDAYMSMYRVGPMPIRVETGKPAAVNEYPETDFTYLSKPLVLEEADGHYLFPAMALAVDTFGVLYIPLDLSRIEAATNFMVYASNLPLDFSGEDVVVYNKDGFDLNLFTLNVEGIERQWGAWYGPKRLESADARTSDLLTYWRHSFKAYNDAHSPGGLYATDTEDEEGYRTHVDGSIHVDHSRLVVAIAAKLRDPRNPEDEAAMMALKPGALKTVMIHVLQVRTEDPDVWEHLSPEQTSALNTNLKIANPYMPGVFISADPWNQGKYDFALPKVDWGFR